MRQIIIALLVLLPLPQASRADERPPLRLDVPPALLVPAKPALSRPSPALHPAARGGLIGAAIGAGAWGGIGLWYCTVGPNEVGECGVEQWVPGLLVWGGVGAGIGALIGAMR